MHPRSRSVFQNYQNFEAWQELPQTPHCSLLQRLNKNLSSYENKYKKYMNFRQDQMKHVGKVHPLMEMEDKQNDNSAFLPQINAEHNFVRHSQKLPRQKVFISQDNHLRDDEIFCERSKNNVKLKTISFDRTSKPKLPFERRKLSLHEGKHLEVEKFFLRRQVNPLLHEKENIQSPRHKVDTSTKMQGYKQLRYRLKKAVNKSRIVHEEKHDRTKLLKREQKENLFFKNKPQIRVSSFMKQVDDEYVGSKVNEFSDKKFYQENINNRYRLQR